MIRVDGSYGEGGGQILRTAVALSCVTCKPVEIINIRANRPKPGLAAQHLKGIETAKIISNAEVEGLKLGSTRVVFRPKRLKGGRFRIDIGTAGSVTLILQTVLLPSLLAELESTFEIIGGTDVSWSPPIDYLKNVTMRAVGEMGAEVEINVRERGYYPRGGGRIEVKIKPRKLEGLGYKEASCDVRGVSHCQNLPQHVAERQARAAKEFLEKNGVSAEISTEVRRGFSTGSGITVWCGYKGGSSLGERGKRAEIVGREAAERFYSEYSMDGIFDSHLADQILPFAAVAHGKTTFTTTKITLHQKSNVYVLRKFLGDLIELDEKNRRYLIKGAGL